MMAFSDGINTLPLDAAPDVDWTFSTPEPVNVLILTLFEPEATVVLTMLFELLIVHGFEVNPSKESMRAHNMKRASVSCAFVSTKSWLTLNCHVLTS